MSVDLVIGAPVWNRHWCLPIWFDSVTANCDPWTTGLVFVVPPSDTLSRDVIADRSKDFAFVEVVRDKAEQHGRETRRQTNHQSLAIARNMLLSHAARVRPDWYLSWDSDFLVSPGVLGEIRELAHQHRAPAAYTVWAWLNRKAAQTGRHWDDQEQRFTDVEWNEPVSCTAMAWEDKSRGVAVHYDPATWNKHARGLWKTDAVLAWQLMEAPVYRSVKYAPHPHGEDIPFNLALDNLRIPRWCYGEKVGLHLFDRKAAEEEVAEGYPAIMRHVDEVPLAARRKPSEREILRTIGFFERQAALS